MSDEPLAADEILDGVYRALCAHGYASLTMQDIADECEKSKSLLHYHYDTKEDLLVAFLSRIITDYEQRLADEADDPPVERLASFLARFVFTPDEDDRQSFHLALLEMRSQGPFNERMREQLIRSDEVLRGTVAEIIRDGIDEGVFDPVDPEQTAALLVATLDGGRTRQVTLDENPTDDSYTRVVVEQAMEHIVQPLLAPGVELPPLDETLAELELERSAEADESDEPPQSSTQES